MLGCVVLAAALSIPVPVADFRTPDVELAPFTLENPDRSSQDSPEVPAAPATPTPSRGDRLFRYLGFLDYLAAGAMTAGQFYRDSRTASFEPAIGNDLARVSTSAAAAEAANMTSEMLYDRGHRQQAWMVRLGTIATFVTYSAIHFDRGWQRR